MLIGKNIILLIIRSAYNQDQYNKTIKIEE
jgi:hypothetical protein